jgi:hypothetical protein
MKKLSLILSMIFAMIFSIAAITPASAEEADDTDAEIALSDVEAEEITDEELTEAEPSELPEADEDEELAEDLAGEMLLDVEGNGEVYYIDPVDGGKEYLANGGAAHRLLERSALGINEENFAKLTQGTVKDEESVCETSDLGKRLKGRIVLRVEMNGEAWWIFPRNCRAYYVGTHEAAYELMRDFSLGVTKENLAKVRDTKRQKLKRAVRFSVYAYAEDNDISLEEARDFVKDEAKEVRQCIKDSGVVIDEEATRADKKLAFRTCLADSDLPEVTKERRAEIKETIAEVREERQDGETNLRAINVRKVKARMLDRRLDNQNSDETTDSTES